MNENRTEVIVIGAGPAGVSAAITLARAGKKVVLTDRADSPGEKNMFGGEIYTPQTLEIFPSFLDEAPLERPITEQRIIMLNEKDSVSFSYKQNNETTPCGFSVIRAKWDKWCVEQAIKEGACFAPKTLVKELLVENGKTTGIITEQNEIFRADIVIIADGVNSLLAKQHNFRKDFTDADVTVNVKEVFKIPKEQLENRFNIDDNSGCGAKILGGPLKDIFAMGFLYTYQNAISLGVGISLDELKKVKLKPFEILDKLKEHPSIKPYIKNAEMIEYSSHLIPEGGIKSLPKLYSDGVMIIGDAAMLVNNVHFEGTNLAMLSGKFAAETAIAAIEKKDFSSSMLSLYVKKLNESIIMKDLKTHKNSIEFVKKHISTITSLYPKLACDFFKVLTCASSKPKNEEYRNFLFNVLKSGAVFKSIPLAVFAMEKCLKK